MIKSGSGSIQPSQQVETLRRADRCSMHVVVLKTDDRFRKALMKSCKNQPCWFLFRGPEARRRSDGARQI
ncbi:MAG: hypothetical protein DWI00_09875 [Planctomycetota bacterium]|nr:MAG: hypothetical protein DWI00_09875 [Planctomycetota bacterium]